MSICLLKHSSKLIHPLCQVLTRKNNLLDRAHIYLQLADNINSMRNHQYKTPIYRSFFQHKLFDKNMIGLFKEFFSQKKRLLVINKQKQIKECDPVSGECLRIICDINTIVRFRRYCPIVVDGLSRLFVCMGV